MKMVSIRETKARLCTLLEEAQRQVVVITYHGKPTAVVMGVEDYDVEDLVLMFHSGFWEMLEKRKKPSKLPSLLPGEMDREEKKTI